MRGPKDVEAYLDKLGRTYEHVDGSTYLLSGKAPMPDIVLRVDAPLVVLRVNVGEVPSTEPKGLLRHLLEVNGKGLVHWGFGLDGNTILLSCAHELEGLDLSELQATLDEIDVALAEELPRLIELVGQK